MKILYIAPNSAHQINYIDAIYREGHEITILTNDLTLHLRRFLVPNFESSYQKVKGPILKAIIKKLIFRLPLPLILMEILRKFVDNSYHIKILV